MTAQPPVPPVPPPFARSLCLACLHARTIQGRATTFLRCTALATKYPVQPVLACAAFAPAKR